MGRPAHSQEELDEARPKVLEVLQVFGFKAGKGTAQTLLPEVPLRVIRVLLKVLKAEHRSERRQERAENRLHTEYRAQGVLQAQDSTHTGAVKKSKAWAEVTRDAATTETRAFGDGEALTGGAMLGHLKARKRAGKLPLVLGLDNGPGNRDARVAEWAAKEEVVLLFNRPRTPTDNCLAERGIGEGKAIAELGTGVQLDTKAQGVKELDQAFRILNQRWPRSTKGGLTAAQLKRTLPHWSAFTTRREFYSATQKAIHDSTTGLKGRALRTETREAIFRTLERFGLILRWRGELRPPAKNQDRLS
jgi:transposase InsO family protein